MGWFWNGRKTATWVGSTEGPEATVFHCIELWDTVWLSLCRKLYNLSTYMSKSPSQEYINIWIYLLEVNHRACRHIQMLCATCQATLNVLHEYLTHWLTDWNSKNNKKKNNNYQKCKLSYYQQFWSEKTNQTCLFYLTFPNRSFRTIVCLHHTVNIFITAKVSVHTEDCL